MSRGQRKKTTINRNRSRRYIALMTVFAMVASILSPFGAVLVNAATFMDTSTGVTWYYEVSNGKAVNVYTTDDVSGTLMLTVPESVDGYSVVSIGGGSSSKPVAPKGYTSVKLPSALTMINPYAFYGITTLKAIGVTGNSLQTVGSNAFEGCTALASIKIDTVLTVDSNAFKGCTALASADFAACTSIGDSAFEGCTAMTRFKISSYATKIGNKAFKGCTALKKAYIPDTVTSFGTEVFSGDTALTDVQLDAKSTYTKTFVNCTALKNIIFGEKVTEVAKDAFTYTNSSTTAKTGGMINYYFLNPKTKIYMQKTSSSETKTGVLKNAISIKSITMTYNAKGYYAYMTPAGPQSTVLATGTHTFNGVANTLSYKGMASGTTPPMTNISGSATYEKSVTAQTGNTIYRGNPQAITSTGGKVAMDTDVVIVNKNINHILANSAESSVQNFEGVNVNISGTWYFDNGTSGYSASSSGVSWYMDHLITLNKTVLVTKSAGNSLSVEIPATISAGYGTAGGSASGVSSSADKEDVIGIATATLALDFSSLTDSYTYCYNSTSGMAGANVYTKTGSFADKTEVQTSDYAYPETLDTNEESKEAMTNGGKTAVNVKDISSAAIPYVVETDSVKLTKITAGYGNAEAVGSNIDVSGVVISCYHNDGSVTEISGDTEGVSFDTTSVSVKGDNTITVTYNGFSASFNVIGFEGKSLKAELNTAYLDGLGESNTDWNVEKQAFKTGSVLTKEMITVKVVSGGEEKETTGFEFVNNEITNIGDNEIVVVLSSDETYKATVTVKGYNQKVEEVITDEGLESGNIFDTLADKVSTLQSLLDETTAQLKEKEAELLEAKADLAASEEQNAELQENLDTTTTELNAAKEELESLKEDMKTVQETLNSLLADGDKVSADDVPTIESIKQQIEAFEAQAAAATIVAENLTAFADDLKELLGMDSDADTDAILEKVTQIKMELDTKKAEVADYEATLTEIKKLLALSGGEDATLEEQLEEITQKIENTVKELDKLQQDLDEAGSSAGSGTGTGSSNAQLQKQIESLQAELTATKTVATSLTGFADNLKSKLGLSADATQEQILAKVDQLLKQLNNGNINTGDINTEELKKTITSLKAQVTSLANNNTALTAENASLVATNYSLRSENTSLKSNNSALENENKDLTNENSALTKNSKTQEAEIKEQQTKIKEQETQIKELEGQLKEAESDNTTLKATNTKLEKQVAALNSQIKVLKKKNTSTATSSKNGSSSNNSNNGLSSNSSNGSNSNGTNYSSAASNSSTDTGSNTTRSTATYPTGTTSYTDTSTETVKKTTAKKTAMETTDDSVNTVDNKGGVTTKENTGHEVSLASLPVEVTELETVENAEINLEDEQTMADTKDGKVAVAAPREEKGSPIPIVAAAVGLLGIGGAGIFFLNRKYRFLPI